jgi:hypothetical protein
VIESDIPESSQLLISFVKTKIKNNTITDTGTLDAVKKLMNSLLDIINKK